MLYNLLCPSRNKWEFTASREGGHMAALVCLQLQLERHTWAPCDYVIFWSFVFISCEPWLSSILLDTFSDFVVLLCQGWMLFTCLHQDSEVGIKISLFRWVFNDPGQMLHSFMFLNIGRQTLAVQVVENKKQKTVRTTTATTKNV